MLSSKLTLYKMIRRCKQYKAKLTVYDRRKQLFIDDINVNKAKCVKAKAKTRDMQVHGLLLLVMFSRYVNIYRGGTEVWRRSTLTATHHEVYARHCLRYVCGAQCVTGDLSGRLWACRNDPASIDLDHHRDQLIGRWL